MRGKLHVFIASTTSEQCSWYPSSFRKHQPKRKNCRMSRTRNDFFYQNEIILQRTSIASLCWNCFAQLSQIGWFVPTSWTEATSTNISKRTTCEKEKLNLFILGVDFRLSSILFWFQFLSLAFLLCMFTSHLLQTAAEATIKSLVRLHNLPFQEKNLFDFFERLPVSCSPNNVYLPESLECALSNRHFHLLSTTRRSEKNRVERRD